METKTCKKCCKELSVEKFGKLKKYEDGLNVTCKECESKFQKEYREKNKEKLKISANKYKEKNKVIIALKHSIYYKENKEHLKEWKRQYCKDHKEEITIKHSIYYEKTKERFSESKIKYRSEHKKESLKYAKEYRTENKETIAKVSKKYRKENHDYLIARNKIYREKNKESLEEKKKIYRKNNPQVYVIIGQKRKAKKRSLAATLTKMQWEEIKKHFDYKCAYCGKDLPLAQEHFLALSKEGEYTLNNIIPSCKSCNSSKATKDFFKWYPNYKNYSKKRERAILKFLGYTDENQQLKII